MDSAKDIAREMLDAININSSGFLEAATKGFISFPVGLGYLGRDFFDTEHRRENQDDKYRLARLIKRTTLNKEIIEIVIQPFIDDFISHIDMNKLASFAKNVAGTLSGKFLFSQITGYSIGKAITSQGVASFISGGAVGALLAIGVEASRAIYTSRYLREKNQAMYTKLNRMGDLDLLYYLVEDIVKPYEKACEMAETDPGKFNKVCEYYFGGL